MRFTVITSTTCGGAEFIQNGKMDLFDALDISALIDAITQIPKEAAWTECQQVAERLFSLHATTIIRRAYFTL